MSGPSIVELSRQGPVHFMGVGGAGMAPLAELVVRSGGRATGCDLRESAATAHLAGLGVPVSVGHDPAHVAGVTAVVVTAAVPAGHAELEAARERGLPVWKRARALGDLVNRGRVVAVAGTHGKTTTTAMATEVLAEGGLEPTGIVGGPVPAWNGNLRHGDDRIFVVEADEYDRSFHALEPDVAVVTNLEADHLDIYGDVRGVHEAFRRFLDGVRPGARVAVCADDPGASRLLAALPVAGYTYGLAAGSQLRAVDVRVGADGTRCRVLEEGRDGTRLHVPVPGTHNLRNAL
ncbi:MAG TPA: Mur ligase family protein, partial [Longimicrobiales bacterium]|nr:Mur ligase family protein [Longimicrobiales bacterium]